MNMPKHLTRIILAAIAGVWITGCADYDTDINGIDQRIDEIEDNRIKTIDQQIERINASLPELEKADQNLKGLIEALQGKADELGKDIEKNAGLIGEANSLIAGLQKKDSELEKKIADLKAYAEGGIKDAKDWASATFATLEQYNGIVEQVAGLGKRLDGAITGLDNKLDKAVEEVKASVSELEKSLKDWVNERLTAYWTIEETKAALESQKDGLERRMSAQRDSLAALIVGNAGETGSLKAALEMAEKSIWNNSDSISALKADLEKAKTDIKDAYEKAIKDAVCEAGGRMSEKVAAEVKTVNDRIDSVVEDVDKKMTALGKRVSDLEKDLKTLKDRFDSRIQSLTYIPRYSDGVERCNLLSEKYGHPTLRFEVRPHSAAGGITKEQVSANAVYTVTRASSGDIEPLTVKSVTADAETGILTVVIDKEPLYKTSTESGLTPYVRIALTDASGNYDIASEYIKVEFFEDPGVLSYKLLDERKVPLTVFDRNGRENELLKEEFADSTFTIYSLNDAESLIFKVYDNELLTDFSINKPIRLKSSKADSLFYWCGKLRTAELNLLDTKDVVSMSSIFKNCIYVRSINVSDWNTQNVTNMMGLFYSCEQLNSIDVSKWNTQNVTDMASMFSSCSGLKSIDLADWNTSNVTDMSRMFTFCKNIDSLDPSKWDTQNVKKMEDMFSYCGKLTSFDLSGWNTQNVETMYQMFNQCASLNSINVSNWNTNSLQRTNAMFCGCKKLKSLDLSGWNTQKVNDMYGMFKDCENLETLDLSNWNLNSQIHPTLRENVFSGCKNLKKITMKNCDDSTVNKVKEMLTEASISENVTIIR